MTALSSCLARAFENDPVSLYLFPRDGSRVSRLERYFTWQLGHVFLPKGEAWTTDDLAGASLWMPPRRRPPTLVEGLGQLLPVLRILGRRTGRALKLVEQLEARHPKNLHCYLGTIGTDPDRQGEGIGSALMRVVLDRLDREEMPAYLESSRPENLPFYHRQGFEVTGEVDAAAGVRLWLMWREPRPESDEGEPDPAVRA
ncbi:MAG: GNAT family N-acetyltransferase [Acidimicrobiales bacterium]